MIRSTAAAATLLLMFGLSACGDDGDQAAHGSDSAGHTMPDGTDMPGMDMSAVGDGMKATVGGYTLAAVKAPSKPDVAGKLTFRIDGPNGVQKDYTRQQTKLMHTYLVRKDLSNYQHIHPSIDPATGIWSVDLTIPEPGPYRVVTEFEALTPDGEFDDRILGTDFTVAGEYKPATAAPAALNKATVDSYELALSGDPQINGDDLTLKVTKDGADVSDLQPYLASFAHITGFREGDLSSVHVHPNEAPNPDDASATGGPELTLAPMFTEAGRYRLFIQFQTGGTVHLVPMDVQVS